MPPLDHLSHCLQKHHINRFVVAVSGGADSMAMAKLAVQYAQDNHSVVHALIVDHKLRPESTQEALYVGQLCQDLGLPYTILTWDHLPLAKGLQEKARKARYELMAAWCKEHHFQYILTAHHANDVLETFMMRLFKGSSLKGLCALTPLRSLYGMTIVRPFLSVNRDDLKAFLGDQPYVQDPSNDNPQFERVRIRQWLNDAPGPVCGFISAYEKLQRADAVIKNMVDLFAHQHIRNKDIDRAPLLALDPLLFERVMKDHILDDFVDDAAIHQLRNALINQQSTTLNHKKFIVINGTTVRISPENGRNDGI